MKSQIKDIVIGIFAVIGFTAIVMGFNNPQEPQQVTYGTPESHVWEILSVTGEGDGVAIMYNKKSGEVRKLNYKAFIEPSDRKREQIFQYIKMSEVQVEQ